MTRRALAPWARALARVSSVSFLAMVSGCVGTLEISVPDAGTRLDAGGPVDAGADPIPVDDAGTPPDRPDAGSTDPVPDAGVPGVDAGPPMVDAGRPAIDADFCEVGGQLVMEAEHYRTQTGYAEVARGDASEGIAMQVGDGGSLDFRIHLETGGTYYFWVRTLAPDAESNGMYVALDGTRIEAPPGHPYAGRSDIYVQKSSTVWFWEPQWQGHGSGAVQGPVTFTAAAGVHTLSIQKRLIERPLIDRIVLTLGPTPPGGLGPMETPCAP